MPIYDIKALIEMDESRTLELKKTTDFTGFGWNRTRL